MSELPKTFEPGAIEDRWYAHWEGEGLFRPDRPDAEPWTIVMPPPNVTGSLHIGHALDITLQDVLVRRERMRGKDALWVVGTDHAGIATQMVVERNLEERQDKRTNYSREEFVAKVWEWKEESGGQITQQLRRLGASCDWAHERFTMDEGFSRAVAKVFVELYKRKLAYRDKRLVNWDPKFHTAISDLEVEMREVDGHMWHFRYPLADGTGYIAIATTRPETILGDGAVAVNPQDERYTHLVGKMCRLPIVDRLIPIIADGHVEMDFGSGAVKITAAHDFNDFEVYKRHPEANIPLINLMTADARMNENTPREFHGLDRYEARKLVVKKFEELGLLDKIEPHKHNIPFGDRSGVVIEPWLTDQWYVDAAKLAQPAIAATRKGEIKIVPETWKKTWFHWLENIQPWCVSRQLWWGHRIPAWYDGDGKIYVAEIEEEAKAEAGGKPLRQDEDVLDTWFSSALWPFATLGWPDETEDLKRHYPNDVLISGFDILFFWDARMAMQGIEFMEQAPWRTLYLHGLVRDAQGQKMSKSKGNTVDPLGLIDKYGADALRFTLAAMESQGRDIKLDEKRVEGYRNFATKLWNAARFLQMNGVGASGSIAAPEAQLPVNRWIIGEVVETLAKLNRAFDELRYDDMADAIYHFVWGTFCDWYVELVKGAFDAETKRVAAWAFDQILVMLHPLMPFITEELWNANPRPYELIVAKWPEPQAQIDPPARAQMEWLIRLVSEIRTARADLNVPPGAMLDLIVWADAQSETIAQVKNQETAIGRLARVKEIRFTNLGLSGAAAQIPVDGVTYVLPLEGVIDIAAEKSRLSKGASAAEKERDSLAARLANPAFTERAKPEAVEKARADHEAKAAEAERLRAALERLG
jgi:valyl-tRNA synthetase